MLHVSLRLLGKNAAENTASFESARAMCTRVLKEEQDKYIVQLRTKISNLVKGCKEWWKLNRILISKQGKCFSIPPLLDGSACLNEPKDKANLFAKTFDMKARLPAETVDCPFFGRADIELEEIVVLRSRRALKLLASLDESKATGPDHIPASILKRIAKEICVPFTILCRRLLQETCWPQIWRLHVICPLYK